MDSQKSQESQRPKIPHLVAWTIGPSLLSGFVFAVRYEEHNHNPMYFEAISEGFAFLYFIVATGVLMVLVWTPLLGAALGLCSIFPKSRRYCERRAWLFFAFMLLPCYKRWRPTQIPK
jgi:hypothetical protein